MAGAGLLPARAHAAEARYALAIPPKTYADALIELALQANVSLVGASACGVAGQVSLSGAYTLDQALQQLLATAPCSYRILDPRTVRILPRQPASGAREPVRAPTFVAELVVTATKRPASLGRIAADISVLSREQIEATGTQDVNQTTGQLAGLLTTNLGPGRDKLLLRGISDGPFTGRARSTVSTYLDETPINYNAPDPDLRLVDVERIEVVRGPQGALYGSGSISGIYRIVTAKPELERFGAGGSLLAAHTRGGAPSYATEAYLNAPFLPGRAALRLVAYRDLQGGYLDNLDLNLTNVDETVRDGARAALRVQVSDAWQLDVSAVGQRLRSKDSQYTTAGLAPGQRSSRVREAHKNDFASAGATLRGELGWASLSASLGRVRHIYASQYDATAATAPPPMGFGTSAQDIGAYLEGARVTMTVADVVLRSSRPGPLTWLVGLYGAGTRENTPASLSVGAPGPYIPQVYAEARINRLRELAAYGEASYDFGGGWTASAGGRLFESRVRTKSHIVATFPAVSRDVAGGRTFSGFSPKLSIQRELGSGDLFYALLSEGYRAGGFNTSGLLPIRATRVAFAPDHLRNYELGAKLRFLDRRLNVRGSLYYDEWRRVQTDQYRPSGLSYTANVGDARIAGIEAEVGYDWDFGLSVQANGHLSESKVVRFNPDFLTSIPGGRAVDELPGAPKSSGGVTAIYQRPLRGALDLRLTAEASYVGRSNVSFDPSVPSRTGGYARARLGADILTTTWSAGVFVVNPTDESGDTFAYGNPFSFSDPIFRVRQLTPQRPRTVGVRLAAAF